jgi:hypothetical protein
MTIDQLFDIALRNMEVTLHALEKRVSPPKAIPFKDGFVYRYTEKTIHQALVQKLARVVTGLHAARILFEYGIVQEQSALHRIIDEFQEDISFLAYAVITDEITELHRQYLSAFYEEEFDNPESPIESTQKRLMVSRKKIRAYIARIEKPVADQSKGIELSRTVHKAYSGFVHGASPAIMDMYDGGTSPGFLVGGMLGTIRMTEYREDLWNYFYRGILAFSFVAMAFGDEVLNNSIRAFRDEFEKQSGKGYAASTRTVT